MATRLRQVIIVTVTLACARGAWAQFKHATPQVWSDNTGFVSLFNGKDLTGWRGRPGVWRVQDGAITASTTPAHPAGISNIWYQGAEPANFVLKVEVRMLGPSADGGIQYRSHRGPAAMPSGRGGARRGGRGPALTPAQRAQRAALRKANLPYLLVGYQADMNSAGNYNGQVAEQGTSRGIVAPPGSTVLTETGRQPLQLGPVASASDIKAWIPNPHGWIRYEIIADGHTLVQMINGHVTAILVDDDAAHFAARGVIGFEIGGQDTTIQYRNIELKALP